MTKKTKKRTSRADAVLSDEEFQKAVEEYKKNRAAKADAEDEEKVVGAEVEVQPEGEFGDIEKKVAEVKERRDRRDEQGDPKDTDEAMGIIAHQDEDLETLFNLIDTLLAKLNFDAAEEEEKAEEEAVEEVPDEDEEIVEEEIDEIEELKGHKDADDTEDEEVIEEEEEDFVEDADDDEEVIDEEEEEEFVEDADEEEELPEDEESVEDEDEDDEEDEFKTDGRGCRTNMDAVDRLVSQKLRMDKLGEQVGIHGLGHKSIGYAKKAIIKSVRPGIRLDGKSETYINACFDMAEKAIKERAKKDTAYQKRQMYSKSRMDSAEANGSDASRRNMIKRQMNHSK